MPSNGVIRSFTVPGGRKILSVKPAALHTAKQAAKDAAANMPAKNTNEPIVAGRDFRD